MIPLNMDESYNALGNLHYDITLVLYKHSTHMHVLIRRMG